MSLAVQFATLLLRACEQSLKSLRHHDQQQALSRDKSDDNGGEGEGGGGGGGGGQGGEKDGCKSQLTLTPSQEDEKLEGGCQLSQGSQTQSKNAFPFSVAMKQLLDKLSTLLPAVRVWVEWMVGHAELWRKPAASEDMLAV